MAKPRKERENAGKGRRNTVGMGIASLPSRYE